jgi:adenine-specific DNA-methyltransferase
MNEPVEALTIDGPESRKSRGAFFTPEPIAHFLARWAISNRSDAKVLDPTCGDGVFLWTAAEELSRLGSDGGSLDEQVYGVDIHAPSLTNAMDLLESHGFDAHLITNDFFNLEPPGGLLSNLPTFDAVIGNPPFVRYQNHTGAARKASAVAALRQGVQLSGLASSWAALLVHAGGFVAPDGRLAMVLPAELLTVGYAEPVRQWLRQRFAAVKLVIFERLQFNDAIENVVLLLAQGTGGCDAFSLYYVHDADDLGRIQPFDEFAVTLSADGKWTDLLLSIRQRQLFKSVTAQHFTPLATYGSPELGTVTGANHYFALNDTTRRKYNLEEGRDIIRISPPGTKHFRGLGFSKADWEKLRIAGDAVWLLCPSKDVKVTAGLQRYLDVGETLGVPDAYKCQVRSTWYRPPAVSSPDLFFTYMSHRYPRLINNQAKTTFLNSMHGVRLVKTAPKIARDALPLLALNSVTMLGAEVYGRSYGGGVLKMEPREAASLPMPNAEALEAAWLKLKSEKAELNRQLKCGLWIDVVARVDEVLLRDTLKLSAVDAATLREAAWSLRARRMSRGSSADADA